MSSSDVTLTQGPALHDWERRLDNSQAITVDGPLVFLSGQAALDAEGHLVGPDDCASQARRTFENLKSRLEANGSSLAGLVKLTVYLRRAEDYGAFVEIRREFLSSPYPASSALVVCGFTIPEMLIEIDAIAAVAD